MNQKRLHHILTAVVLAVCILQTVASCNKKDSTDPSATPRLEQLRREATSAASMHDFGRSDSIGRLLYREAETASNDIYMAYGLMCQSFYAYTSQGADNRLKTLKEAECLALDTKNDSLLSRIYNVLGTYSVAYTHNFEDSKRYFTEAIRYARQAGAPDFAIAGECNLSELYRRRGDTLGIKYDIDIYHYADKVGNRDLLLSAAEHCAEYYLRYQDKVDMALPYINRLRELGDEQQYHRLYANYLFVTDSIDKAEKEYTTYVDFSKGGPSLFYNYGMLLLSKERYVESTEMLQKAETLYDRHDPHNAAKINIYKMIAENSERLGHDKEALLYLQRYFSARDSLEEVRKNEDMQKYKVKFDVEKKELALRHEKESGKLKTILIIVVIGVFLLTVAAFMFYIRRRNKLHRVIVAQHLEALRRQNSEEKVTAAPETEESHDDGAAEDPVTPETPDNLPNGLSERKASEIWQEIQTLMERDRIFTDPQLSRDTFAEKVGCNHTWFSQVIKTKTGKTYTQFINSLRVEEAIRLLSAERDALPQREVALRAGFLSPSSFYSAFRQQTGMSPAEFRKQMESIETSSKLS